MERARQAAHIVFALMDALGCTRMTPPNSSLWSQSAHQSGSYMSPCYWPTWMMAGSFWRLIRTSTGGPRRRSTTSRHSQFQPYRQYDRLAAGEGRAGTQRRLGPRRHEPGSNPHLEHVEPLPNLEPGLSPSRSRDCKRSKEVSLVS